jgi:dynein heavy chain
LITILRQEVDRYNKLLNVIHKTLSDLMRAIKGEIMISRNLEKTFEKILIQKVPDEWEVSQSKRKQKSRGLKNKLFLKAVAYPSMKSLAYWVKNLNKRIKFFSLWLKTVISFAEGTSTCINPFSFWISGFFFPQGLITAISQNYARKLSVSIDSLQFEYMMQDHLVEDFEFEITKLFENEDRYKVENIEGVLICGLFLDGVKWDFTQRCIVDSEKRFNVAPYFLCKVIQVSRQINIER